MKLRDILAIPFWTLAMALDWLAVAIGGEWTAQMFIETVQRQNKALKTIMTQPTNKDYKTIEQAVVEGAKDQDQKIN